MKRTLRRSTCRLSPTFLKTQSTSSSKPRYMPPMTSLWLMPLAIEVRTMNSLSRSLDLIRIKSRWSLYHILKRPSADFIPSVTMSSFDLGCSPLEAAAFADAIAASEG